MVNEQAEHRPGGAVVRPAPGADGASRGPAAPSVAGGGTRRERQRQATYEEIVTTARTALNEGQSISLRAIASEMGMATSALYRYIDSHADLQRLVATSVYRDVIASILAAAERYPPEASIERTFAAVCAFRRWALGHPAEFRLVFTPLEAPAFGGSTEADFEATPAALTFGIAMLKLQVPMVDDPRLTWPDERDLPPRAQEALRQLWDTWGDDPRFPIIDKAARWYNQLAWAHLLGVITLEVSGQCAPEMVATDALFAATLENVAMGVASGVDREAIRAMIDVELAASSTEE